MRKVIGIGEMVMDIIFRNGQPTAAVPGGSTLNSLISLGRAGAKACMVSETGSDAVGSRCCSFMAQNGVDSQFVTRYGTGQSAISLAMLDEQNDAKYMFYGGDFGSDRHFSLPRVEADDVVLFGSYYSVRPDIRPQVRAFLEAARKAGAILYYDINFRPSHAAEKEALLPAIRENMSLCHIVRASAEDCQTLLGTADASAVYGEHIASLAKDFILTNGSHSATLFADDRRATFPVAPCKAVSTIGAGDNFNAGVIYSLLKQNISRTELPQLPACKWKGLIATAMRFAANVCGSINNYIDAQFAESLKRK